MLQSCLFSSHICPAVPHIFLTALLSYAAADFPHGHGETLLATENSQPVIMLKQEFPPELDWFIEINIRVDLGYLGIRSDYRGERIDIPTKKPRKSKKNPNQARELPYRT